MDPELMILHREKLVVRPLRLLWLQVLRGWCCTVSRYGCWWRPTRRNKRPDGISDYMMKALKDIGTTEESNHKFIEVWEVFGKKVEEKERYDQERWLDLIAEVGMILCRKIS
jgi:hypothetical protein